MSNWLTFYLATSPSNLKSHVDSGFYYNALITFSYFVNQFQKGLTAREVEKAVVQSVKNLHDTISLLAKRGYKVMLDSGAFTNFQKPGHVTLNQYVDYLNAHKEHWSEYITFDDLASRENTIKNHKLLLSKGFSPILVDHIRFKDHHEIFKFWKKDDKIAVSAFGNLPDPNGRKLDVQTDVMAQLKNRFQLAREVKTKVHILAASTLNKMLPFADVIDSVDSSAWSRSMCFNRCIALAYKDLGDLKMPVMLTYDAPYRKKVQVPMPAEVLDKYRAFAKECDGSSHHRVTGLFNVQQSILYAKAINKLAPQQIIKAIARHKEAMNQKKCVKTYFDFLPVDAVGVQDAWQDASLAARESRGADLAVIDVLDDKTVRLIPDAQLTDMHDKMHLAAEKTQEGASLAEPHLFVLQEIVRRGMPPCKEDDILVDETAVLAKGIGLTDEELDCLGLLIGVGKATVLQTLILAKDIFRTVAEAKKWISDHNFAVKEGAPDETGTSYRFRQREPSEFRPGTFRTIDVTEGVKGVVGELKKAEKSADSNEDGDEAAHVTLLPVDKAAEDKRIVFGVVLEPDSVDSQGDTISPDEIENAAHLWLARFQNRGLMHKKIVNGKMDIYESYVAPVDMVIDENKVKKGTWLVMYYVKDDTLWEAIKSGELTGFSMGGFARRQQL